MLRLYFSHNLKEQNTNMDLTNIAVGFSIWMSISIFVFIFAAATTLTLLINNGSKFWTLFCGLIAIISVVVCVLEILGNNHSNRLNQDILMKEIQKTYGLELNKSEIETLLKISNIEYFMTEEQKILNGNPLLILNSDNVQQEIMLSNIKGKIILTDVKTSTELEYASSTDKDW